MGIQKFWVDKLEIQYGAEIKNKILEGYATKHTNITYLYSNFKKDKGLEKAQQIIKETQMYSQNYCGCKFSIRETNKE